MTQAKSIVWEHFKSPFQQEMEEVDSNFSEDDKFEDSYSEMEMTKKPTFIMTQNGQIFPAKMFITPDKSHKMWVGHTNFDIDDKVRAVIDTVPGVEGLQVISRYRMLVSIGKNPLFQDREVFSNIQRLLCDNDSLKMEEVKNEV